MEVIMTEKTVFQPDEDREKADCKTFAELLRSKYEPSEESSAIVFIPKYLMDRFEETFDYRPEASSLNSALVAAGFTRQIQNGEDDFAIGYGVILR